MLAEPADRFRVDGSTLTRMPTIKALAGSGVTHEQKQRGRRDQPGARAAAGYATTREQDMSRAS
jgi:hypothetical protein